MPTQLFTKAVSAKPVSAKPVLAAPKASLSSVSDHYGLARLAKSAATTPQGMIRLADKIIGESLPQPIKRETKKTEAMTYAEQRCTAIDPNAYCRRVPYKRIETPHEARKRRPPGWTDCRLILPKLLLEGLRVLTIELAHQQQNSEWPGERRRYPATKNYHVAAALNAYLRQLGFEQFCVEEQKSIGRCVRRFVGPSI